MGGWVNPTKQELSQSLFSSIFSSRFDIVFSEKSKTRKMGLLELLVIPEYAKNIVLLKNQQHYWCQLSLITTHQRHIFKTPSRRRDKNNRSIFTSWKGSGQHTTIKIACLVRVSGIKRLWISLCNVNSFVRKGWCKCWRDKSKKQPIVRQTRTLVRLQK